jgi:formamidopyrimidine-DNA glycosylase
MPELPEVETALRELEPLLQGRSVTGVTLRWPRTLAFPAAEPFAAALVGQRFGAFARRGKYMLFGLTPAEPQVALESIAPAEHDQPLTLIVHLRMTGRLRVEAPGQPADAHTHLLLALDDGQALHFRDPRKFGRVWLTEEPALILRHLGPEPDDPALTAERLVVTFAGRRAAIKALLLDQSIWAGVGNIYADEALHVAQIDPRRAAGSLSPAEVAALLAALRSVLADAIAHKGSSLGLAITNYQRPGGESGGYQEAHRVFRRTGEPCLRCGAPIARVVIAQRSTHFCPECQR